jgi:hypothetical protein
VINITNFTCQDNPPGPARGPTGDPVAQRAGTAAGRSAGTAAGRPGGSRRHLGGRVADIAGLAAAVLLSWLAYIPRRLGDRLFSWNDTEAYWRGWQIIRVHGGLGRRYRDPRFDALTACPQCQGGGSSARDTPCAPCLGTGRVSAEGVS